MSEKKSEKKSANKGIVIMLILTFTLLLVVAGFFGYMIFFKPKTDSANQANNTAIEKPVEEKILALDEIVTNLRDEGRTRYIKIKLTLGYTSSGLDAQINSKMHIIKNDILITLMNKTSDDLKAQEIDKVIKELKDKINSVLGNEKITNVYINDFIIQ